MAISKYFDPIEKKDYWKVYVSTRSEVNKKIRFQKARKKIESKSKATQIEKKFLQEVLREQSVYDGKGLIWADVFHCWFNEVRAGTIGNVSKDTERDYYSIINHWTTPWMRLSASDIGRAQGRDLLNRLLNKNLSKRYIKKILNLVNTIYTYGLEEGYIRGNAILPCKGLKLGTIESKVPDILSLEEIKKLLNAAQSLSHPWYHVWAMALLTGMRSGELLGLNWEQIDFEKNIILIDRSYNTNRREIGPTKGRYWRTFPISTDLKSLLIEIKGKHPRIEGGFVLPRIKGWLSSDQASILRNFLKSIGIKGIKFHALRACWATQLLASGVPAAVVMKLGGWKKMSTMDIYIRLAGVEVQGSTDSLNFIPNEIDYSAEVVNLSAFRKTGGRE